MGSIIDISQSKLNYIHFFSNQETKKMLGKGWSYSFVYSLIELRDVFIAAKINSLSHGIPAFTEDSVVNKIPFAKSPWDSRRVLEAINALKNFGLIDIATNKCKDDIFEHSLPGCPLSENDKSVFRDIFFKYFRFIELSSLFVDPMLDKCKRVLLDEDYIINNSIPLYSFISNRGYVDSFFTRLDNNPDLFQIPDFNECGDNNSGLRRFWDVFISWGQQLGVIERFNMKNSGFKLSNDKTFSCSYFICDDTDEISVFEFIKDRYVGNTFIDIADLILNLCLNYRLKVEIAQNKVLSFYAENKNNVSLIRTSEIFIKERDFSKNDKVLYPKYQDSFVSHLKLRK